MSVSKRREVGTEDGESKLTEGKGLNLNLLRIDTTPGL